MWRPRLFVPGLLVERNERWYFYSSGRWSARRSFGQRCARRSRPQRRGVSLVAPAAALQQGAVVGASH
eukprot:161380-Alexandrium_andersonii.AAC.1